MDFIDTIAVDTLLQASSHNVNTSWWSVIISLILGLVLSASCGFKVFLAPLGIGIAYHTIGFPMEIELSEGLMWVVSWQAMLAFSVASFFEISVGFIPWLGDFMDWVNLAIVPVMGTIATSSFLIIEDPMIKWTLAIIVGGSSSLATGFTDNVIGNGMTLITGGLGRPVVEIIKICLAIFLIILSLILPFLALAFIILFFIISFFIIRKIRKVRKKRKLKKASV